jgi:tRNA-(ms[2]io[6]A)-hydroxylase
MRKNEPVAEKRRLPVLSAEPPPADDDESRPEWQWVGFGVVAMFAAWLPLAAAAGMFSRRVAEGMIGGSLDAADTQAKIAALDAAAQRKLMASFMGPHVVALALSGVFAGFVIGKFGQGGGRAASVAAGIVCIVAGLLAVRDLSSLLALLCVVVVAVLSARGGATWGARKRKG